MKGRAFNKKWLRGLLLMGIFATLLWKINSFGWLAINFVDEQDNLVVGSYVTEGAKIYDKVFTHHQPASYLISAGIQRISKANTIQSLVKQHRMVVSIWSIAWLVFLGLRFGPGLAMGMMIFELVKKLYLGNMFLAESLTVAPVIYLVLVFIKGTNSKLESVFIGLMFALVGLLLAPMWPLVGILGLGWLIRWRKDVPRIAGMVISALSVVVASSFFVDIGDYIKEAILINKEYYIKIAGGDNMVVSLVKSVLTPFEYLVEAPRSAEAGVIKVMVLLFIIGTLYLLKKKNYKEAALIWILVSLSNLRNFELEKIYYDGFHLIIWVGLIISMAMFLLSKKKKMVWIGVLPIIFLLITNLNLLREKANYEEDFEIYYSRIFNMSETIRRTREEGDRLLSMPDQTLAYWKTGVEPAGRFIFFYKWMSGVEELREEQMDNFRSKPEYMIIKSDEGLKIGEFLTEYQKFQYREDEGASEFYIRKDFFENMSDEKKEIVKYYGLKEI